MLTIRQAASGDYRPCATIDRSFTTSYVWQLEQRFEGEAGWIAFRPVPLPRSITVSDSTTADQLVTRWLQSSAFLIAEDDGPVGYVALDVDSERRAGHVRDLVIRTDRRRMGVGSRLVGEVRQWARGLGLHLLLAEIPTRNYPALRFLLKNGFAFCGYHEHAYSTRDILVYFALTV